MEYLILARRFHDFEENVAGGGLRLLALLLATMTLIPLTVASSPSRAQAADSCPVDTINTDTKNWKELPYGGATPLSIPVTRAGRSWTMQFSIVGNTEPAPDMSVKLVSPSGDSTSFMLEYVSLVGTKYCNNSDGSTVIANGNAKYLIVNPDGSFLVNQSNSWDALHKVLEEQDGTFKVSKTVSGEPLLEGKNSRFILQGSSDLGWDNDGNISNGFVYGYRLLPEAPFERYLTLNANGGEWADGSTTSNQNIDTGYKGVTDVRPTRSGFILDSWNTKADGTGDNVTNLKTGLQDGQTVYAIWKKDPGKPRNVQIDCSPRKAGGVLCSVMAYYNGATVQTRELATTGTNNPTWAGDPIAGVNLDRNGYAADMSCTTRGDGDSQCYYASLAEEPAQNNSYQAQMPTTGAPEGLSMIGVIALTVSMLGLTVVSLRRRA